jgi:hypothetical protein
MLDIDSLFGTNFMHIFVNILTSIIISKDLNPSLILILNECFKFFKILKNLRFQCQKIHPCEARVIVDKSEYILIFSDWGIGEGSHEITMNHMKRWGIPTCFSFFKFLLDMFTKNATLTDPIGKFDLRHVDYHVFFAELMQVPVIKMPKYLMP